MAPRRSYNGYSNVTSDNPLGMMPYVDPTKWAIYHEHFLTYDLGQATTYWSTASTGGTDGLDGPRGVLTLTLSGSNNDLMQLYHTTAVWQTIVGKKMIFKCQLKVAKGSTGNIGEEELFFGLSSVQTATAFFNAGGTAREMDDAIGFASYVSNTGIDCIQGENNTFSTETGATSYADDTWLTLSWYYDGASTFFYKNDIKVATLTTNIATSIVTPMLYIKAGEAKAKVLHVDQIFVASEE